MASEEQATLIKETEEGKSLEVEGTIESVDIQTFYFTSEGVLKPIGGRDAAKFCKAINLVESAGRKRNKRPSAKAREAMEMDEKEEPTVDQSDPEFDIANAENTPLFPSPRARSASKKCDYCKKVFSEKGLIKHIKNKHPEKVSIYSRTVPLELTNWMCPYCEEFFHTRVKLTKHVKESHPEKDDEFSVILDLDMSSEVDIAKETDNGEDENNEAGDKTANRKRQGPSVRVFVQKRRKSEYPKPCPDCGEMIDKSSRWFDHKKKHIPLEERKNHQCGYCDQMYTKRALEVHIKTMHPETVPEQQRTWECRYCDRVFRRTNTRHYHELSHKEDSKKFVCDVCNYGFINRSQLRKHRLTHSNTSVRCSKCRFLFENVDKLTAHCERVHPGVEVYGMVNEVKARTAPIQRGPRRRTKEGANYVKPMILGEIGLDVYESDDSNEANEMYERSQKLMEKKEDGGEGDGAKDDGTPASNLELFRCKLCNIFYNSKAALAEHCLDLHNDMMEKLVLAGL